MSVKLKVEDLFEGRTHELGTAEDIIRNQMCRWVRRNQISQGEYRSVVLLSSRGSSVIFRGTFDAW